MQVRKIFTPPSTIESSILSFMWPIERASKHDHGILIQWSLYRQGDEAPLLSPHARQHLETAMDLACRVPEGAWSFHLR